jgi:general stress protein YciG
MPSSESIRDPKRPSTGESTEKPRSRRGFAGMDRAQVRALASRGGKAAHEQGTAHEFTSEEARAAGRKGGLASHKPRDSKPAPSGESDKG